MGLELRRDADHNLRSKWWYGRYTVNGKRRFINLDVEVQGNPPADIRSTMCRLPAAPVYPAVIAWWSMGVTMFGSMTSAAPARMSTGCASKAKSRSSAEPFCGSEARSASSPPTKTN